MRRRHVVIFAKAPRLGSVKRRLAAEIGNLAAWRFYRHNLAGLTRRLGGDPRWATWLAVTPDRDLHLSGLWPARIGRIAQGRGDLGVRMARTFRAFAPAPVLIVGSDIPAITAAGISGAFATLGRCDAVFGPSRDGGYWLIGWRGSRPLPPAALTDVRWSTTDALADSRASLGVGPSIAEIDIIDDIDDAAGYARWQARDKTPG